MTIQCDSWPNDMRPHVEGVLWSHFLSLQSSQRLSLCSRISVTQSTIQRAEGKGGKLVACGSCEGKGGRSIPITNKSPAWHECRRCDGSGTLASSSTAKLVEGTRRCIKCRGSGEARGTPGVFVEGINGRVWVDNSAKELRPVDPMGRGDPGYEPARCCACMGCGYVDANAANPSGTEPPPQHTAGMHAQITIVGEVLATMHQERLGKRVSVLEVAFGEVGDALARAGMLPDVALWPLTPAGRAMAENMDPSSSIHRDMYREMTGGNMMLEAFAREARLEAGELLERSMRALFLTDVKTGARLYRLAKTRMEKQDVSR